MQALRGIEVSRREVIRVLLRRLSRILNVFVSVVMWCYLAGLLF